MDDVRKQLATPPALTHRRRRPGPIGAAALPSRPALACQSHICSNDSACAGITVGSAPPGRGASRPGSAGGATPAAGAARRGRPHLRHPRLRRHDLLRDPRQVDHQPGARRRPGCRSSGPSTPTAAAPTPASTASPATPTPTSTSTPATTSTRKIIVKVNAGELLRRELAAPRWRGAADRHGHQRRLLPAGRGPLPADAGDHRGAARLRQPVLHPHQGHADPARPRPARAGRRGHRVGLAFSVGFVDEAAVARGRARHPEPAPPARRGAPAHRRRLRRSAC